MLSGLVPACKEMQQPSLCFPPKVLHPLASGAVLLSFLPLLQGSCAQRKALVYHCSFETLKFQMGILGPSALIFQDSAIFGLKETARGFRNGPLPDCCLDAV